MTGSVLLVLGAFLIFLVNANQTIYPDDRALAAMNDEMKEHDHKLHLSDITLNDEQFPEAIGERKAPPVSEDSEANPTAAISPEVSEEPEVSSPALATSSEANEDASPEVDQAITTEKTVESSTNS